MTQTKGQSIASAIKRGEATGWEPSAEGHFEASTRKSENQTRRDDGPRGTLYDVWARFVPAE